jgi:GT2 family glycosyltransferase
VYDVIVPTIHFTKVQKEFYASLKNTDIPEKMRLLVIYNGNDIRVARWLEKNANKVWNAPKNMGVAKSWNWGSKQSKENHLILLNDDIILPKFWLETFDWALQENGFVSATQIRNRDTYNKNHTQVDLKKVSFVETGPPPGFAGCCFAVSRHAFNTIGAFDENFTFIANDTDYFLRAKEAGFTPYRIEGFIVYHHNHFSMSRLKNEREARAKDRKGFFEKYPDKKGKL